ncbi:cobalamin biosynthesis protein [Dichotomicrobium thermohalophilum]|uniref:Cobalt-precorrin 5A hydrolase n=1 Tax=Dichotomicrobium thermohalophilum TaxID=933063 RepID=A0A397PIE9_9HYPH|nr:cobalamin biosynthesis protein [Dichotomicrobium thermohalophilum]RIA45451.1 cobalt-precorrin 5A hydrolase [Dichotomicrobium thermohalophilum]
MIVAGFGFRAAATADSLRDALAHAAGERKVTAFAAPEDKAQAACLSELAREMGVSVRAISANDLSRQQTPTEAPRVRAARHTGSVAEAAALAAAGPGARLLAPRHISADRLATCAIAIGEGA